MDQDGRQHVAGRLSDLSGGRATVGTGLARQDHEPNHGNCISGPNCRLPESSGNPAAARPDMTSARAAAEAGGHAARFAEIWCADFEFRADPGEHPWPVCMVAQELKTGEVIRLWRDEL